jgi:membrane associated rhomboid family serine protease/Zn-finger nucleic acid-binding protein
MLTCPTCQHVLVEVPTMSGLKQSICLDCGGRSLAIETLSKVLSPLTFKRLISGYRSSRTISDRRCPACHACMRKVQLGVLGKLRDVEVCGHSELAWFDSHEFENLPLTNEADKEIPLPPHVQEALNEIETHHGHVVANRSTFRLDAGDYGFGWKKDGEDVPSLWKAILAFVLLLPIKREHRLAKRPWVTWTTIAIVMGVSIYGFSHETFVDHWALDNEDLLRHNGLTLVTYFFLHGSWMHVLGNMYYLWFFGDSVEDELGTTNYILTLIAGTVGAALFHALISPSGYSLLVGASGGISTLGMIYMLRFPRAKLGFFLIVGWLRVPAYLLLIIWVVMQVSMAYDQVAGLTQVSALAHLGGALVGLASFILFLRKPPHERADA